jgi:hypothetical protein
MTLRWQPMRSTSGPKSSLRWRSRSARSATAASPRTHTAAVLHGATVAEAAEAIGVTFLMNGGPATVYGARAFAAFQEFHREYAERRTEPSPAR